MAVSHSRLPLAPWIQYLVREPHSVNTSSGFHLAAYGGSAHWPGWHTRCVFAVRLNNESPAETNVLSLCLPSEHHSASPWGTTLSILDPKVPGCSGQHNIIPQSLARMQLCLRFPGPHRRPKPFSGSETQQSLIRLSMDRVSRSIASRLQFVQGHCLAKP